MAAHHRLLRVGRISVLALVVLGAIAGPVAIPRAVPVRAAGATTAESLHNDTSSDLRSTPPTRAPLKLQEAPEPQPLPRPKAPIHPALPSPASSTTMPAPIHNFVGQGNGLGTVGAAPPDTSGAVGPNHYVQAVNASLAVFDKTGRVLLGPVAMNTLWSGFGGLCQTDNDGDPVVRYDRMADRWVILQFAVSGADGGATPFLICVAVSATADPTGAYHRYSFAYTGFADYPKFSVWPDAYYLTVNLFNAGLTSFLGSQVSALDRNAMLAGSPATWESFTVQNGGILPADLDGPAPPPAGSPNYMLSLGGGASTLAAYKFHTDFATPGNASFSGPFAIATAPFSDACSGGTCIQQPGTSQQLDSLGDRLMFRVAYRNFGDHESLVASHSVTTSTGTGVRWYELRIGSGLPVIYQQGTYSPDSQFRWIPSIAMDGSGDIAVGYSTASSSTYPSLDYAGRLASDPINTMGATEGLIVAGAGSQTNGLSRFGDYSQMSVDPTDDCTFWFSSEYLTANGSFNWSTRVASFKFPSCGASDFSIGASAVTQVVPPGGIASYTVSTAVSAGSAGNVSLSASGLPAGATASFSPATVAAGGVSTLTVRTSPTTPLGTSTITVTGTGPATSHGTTVLLGVSSPTNPIVLNGGFETGSLAGWSAYGPHPPAIVRSPVHSGSFAAVVGSGIPLQADSYITQAVAVPAGATTLSFWYMPHCPDSPKFDQLQAQVFSPSGLLLASALNTCTNTNAWTPVTLNIGSLAGQTVILYFNVHDDGFPTDPSYMFVDDVAIT